MSETNEISRREFVAAATVAACACLLCPSTLLRAAGANPAPLSIGALKDFAQDGVVDKWARSNGFFVIRQEGKLYASSSLCTHKGTARLNTKPADGQFVCNQHGSRFTLRGTVAHGPARRALPRYAIRVGDDGAVVVDTSQRFEEDQWSEPASFVKIP